MEEKNNRNREIYQEYLNSCIARNEATKNTTYKIYSNNMKQFIDYVKKYENNSEKRNENWERKRGDGFER